VVAGAGAGTAIATAIEGCGMVVPPGDGLAMAAAVAALAGDEQARRRLGDSARARALADWDREAILTAYERALM